MFIRTVTVQNFRLFSPERPMVVDCVNIPDGIYDGSGLTVFVGENGCGKTALLDAIALPLLSYKADNFAIHDFNDPNYGVHIEVHASSEFEVDGTMPRNKFRAKGFMFQAKVRERHNKAYLSSVAVTDQLFIKADGAETPKDGSPDLRVSVNNPFKGQRFAENDILFLDRNRTFQTRSGTYNPTRFDRLMEDFSYQYMKSQEPIPEDINSRFDDIKASVANQFLVKTIAKFKEISGSKVTLSFVDNWRPFDKCFFAEKRDNQHQVTIDRLGSGYEMIFALLYAFFLSEQSGKQLIVLIDEPELHLHPSLQERFVELLLEFAKSAQIIMTTHSPLLVKQLLTNERVKTCVLVREPEVVQMVPVGERLLPFISSGEINYLAFGLASEEHHNELYEELKYRVGVSMGIKDFDIAFFQGQKQEKPLYPWKGNPDEISIHTHVRNQIHHQKENGKAAVADIRASIETMRRYLAQLPVPDSSPSGQEVSTG